MNLTCEICGKSFEREQAVKTCSKKCELIYRNERMGQSLCYTCGRAYSKPFICGGCEKILYGWKIYDEAKEVRLGDGTMTTKVTKCKFWTPPKERRRGTC